MQLKRFLISAIVSYLGIFAAAAVVLMLLGVDASRPDNLSVLIWLITMLITLTIVGLTSHWYFAGRGVAGGTTKGLEYGIGIVVLGFFFDLLSIIPIALPRDEHPFKVLLEYYSQPYFLPTLAVVIAISIFTGHQANPKAK